MESIWNELYEAAKWVQNERKISDYIDESSRRYGGLLDRQVITI